MRLPVTSNDLAPKRDVYLLGAILIALLLVGSVGDLAISTALVNQRSAFGLLLAGYGEAPAMLALTAAGTLLITGRSPRSHRPVLRVSAGISLLVVSFIGLMLIPAVHLQAPLLITATTGLILVSAVTLATHRVSRKTDPELVLKVAMVLIAVVFLELFIVNILKLLWERPRMRMISVTDSARFQPWWSPGYAERAGLREAGIAGEEFKSFPSGHTANAACALLLTLLAALKETWRPRVELLFWLGALWALLVAFSRIIMGAHFVTDTVAGLSVTFIIVLVMYRLAFKPPAGKIPGEKPS